VGAREGPHPRFVARHSEGESLGSMFGYATDLRSRTKGRATYAMEFDHYAELPQQIRDDLMSRAR
jgi:elongation factor G